MTSGNWNKRRTFGLGVVTGKGHTEYNTNPH